MINTAKVRSISRKSVTRRGVLVSGLAIGAGVAGLDLVSGTLAAAQSDSDAQYLVNASDFVAAVDWDIKETPVADVNEEGFNPADLTFEVGVGYEFTITNTGTESYFFNAPVFMLDVATRKTESSQTEVKMPYFEPIEILPGQWVEYYFVPIKPGTYDFTTGAVGSEDTGVAGTIEVTGEAIEDPVPVYAPLSEGEWLQDGMDLVEAADWEAAETVVVEIAEYSFSPDVLTFTAGMPYKIEAVNVGTKKHELGAEEFYASAAVSNVTDASGVYMGPQIRVIEVFPGSQADVYIIPTEAGEFEMYSEIEDDYEQGLVGQIVVEGGS